MTEGAEPDLSIYARLQIHEFFLEVAFANAWASVSSDAAEKAADQLRRLMRKTYTGQALTETEADTMLAIGQMAATMSERLIAKILARAATIRAEMGE